MIRQAGSADLEAIVSMRESATIDMDRLDDVEYRVNIQRNGFLLPSGPGAEELEKKLPEFSVVDSEGMVEGCFSTHVDQVISPEERVKWLKPYLKDAYFSRPQGRIAGISVGPDSRQKGVATTMLEAAEQKFRAQNINWLFAFVVLTPVTNFASMMLHEKNGFERAAVPEPYTFVADNGFTIDGYQFMLYGKHLTD